MGLFGKILSLRDPHINDQLNTKGFKIADCEPEDCEGCSSKFPSSLSIDMDTPLWNSTKEFTVHLLPATGSADWKHDIGDEHDTLCEQLCKHSLQSKLETISGGNVKVSASSIALPHEHFEVDDIKKAPSSVLILPYFLNITNTNKSTVNQDVEQVFQLWQSSNRRQELKKMALESGALVNGSQNIGYILLCSHRTRDKRCGITAPIMKKEFEKVLREHDLYRDASDDRPGGVNLHYVSHVGGHKFSANVIIYLKTGEIIWCARTRPEHCRKLIEVTMLQGKVFPELLRQAFKVESVDW